MAEAKYIYGIVNSSAAVDVSRLIGLAVEGTNKTELITFKDISAVASSWTNPEVPASEENLKTHTSVLEALVKTTTVLPVEFGTVAPSSEDVAKMLKKNYSAIVKTIKSVHSKTEVNLRVLWKDIKQVFETIVKENIAIAKLKSEIASKPYDATYKQRIIIGEMVAEKLDEKREKITNKILGSLKKYASKIHVRTPVGDEMIFNVFFLLEKEKINLFDEALDRVSQAHSNVNFKYTGPLLPYSFIDIKLKV